MQYTTVQGGNLVCACGCVVRLGLGRGHTYPYASLHFGQGGIRRTEMMFDTYLVEESMLAPEGAVQSFHGKIVRGLWEFQSQSSLV
jgi:hypothetical protein